MSFISPFILFCYLYPPSLIKKIKIKKKKKLLFISYAQIVLLSTYFHGYLLLIIYHICQTAILPTLNTFMVFEVIIIEQSDRKSILS